MSNKVTSIFSFYVDLDNLLVLYLTFKHLDKIESKQINIHITDKIVFGLINVFGSKLKGKHLMLDVFELIKFSQLANQVEFVVLGDIQDGGSFISHQYPFVKFKANLRRMI